MRLFIVVPGVLFALAGLFFTLQGLGIAGPQSSFMYESTTWIVQGLAIFFAGALVVLFGVWRKGPPKRA